MGKIVYLMGKSSSGKDTIFKRIVDDKSLELKKIVPYTTRPIRAGEKNGVEYFFLNEEEYGKLEKEGKIIESRTYNTIHGPWIYFTVNDNQIDLEKGNSIIIGTLESYVSTAKYFGDKLVLPVMIELDDGVRLQRALDRERNEKNPKYEEMCRRFLADSADFSEEKIQAAGIKRRFINNDLEACIREIKDYIRESL